MKFTYFCEPGRFLSPRQHYCYIGDWIRPAGGIVLQHGTFSPAEWSEIQRNGFIRVYEDWKNDLTYLESFSCRDDMRKHQQKYRIRSGTLRQTRYNNMYTGMVMIYGRKVINELS